MKNCSFPLKYCHFSKQPSCTQPAPLLKQGISRAPPHACPGAACDSDLPGSWHVLLRHPKNKAAVLPRLSNAKNLKAATPSSCKRRPASCVNLNTKVDELRPCELLRHLHPMRCNGLGLGMCHGHPVYVLPLISPALLEKPRGF